MTTHPAQVPVPGAIFSALPIPAFMTGLRDGDEVILDCNPAAEQFLSASAPILRGAVATDRLYIDAPMEEAMARARHNRAPIFINDCDVSTSEKPSVLCTIQIAPMNDPADTLLLLITPRDIAGRLGRTRVVKAAAKSAIGMSEMLAHEIKNPLAGIAGAAQLLSMGLNAADRELTDLIVAETRRIVKLLDQVEQFGDQRPPDRKPINIHDVLERARRSATVSFGAHMQLSDDYDPSLPDVWADPDQLQQVFLNLIKNASEAQPQGGKIRIHTYFERGLQVAGHDERRVALPLHVEIIDDGPGLPAAIAENIFEPFVSGRENGTGLGLALVSKIIAAHEGWIEVKSRPGQTIFRVSLPMAPTTTKETR
ncbi:two-component system sensor histidine kinase NtrB [Pararhodobacter zhoushanensis]|uniref:two-component system sensor histidine kinase NtrB n=1 Tax=Pararhodobacter zhoushanensis TaxID=2479545 RepID=UPI000F8CF430|nr:ATP-binding protein [Pararhodobacter zhoushanensis]